MNLILGTRSNGWEGGFIKERRIRLDEKEREKNNVRYPPTIFRVLFTDFVSFAIAVATATLSIR